MSKTEMIPAEDVRRGDGWGRHGTVRFVETLPDGRIDITIGDGMGEYRQVLPPREVVEVCRWPASAKETS